jgi:outer membrane receptor protein involved in Fe transport
MRIFLIFIAFLLNISISQAQKASISGHIKDGKNQTDLSFVNVYVTGTTFGATSDALGKYIINNIPPGEYTIECSFVGYEKQLFTGIKFVANEAKVLDIVMNSIAITGNVVKIIGEKPLIDVENGKSQKNVGRDIIDASPVKDVQSLLNNQQGIVQNSEGIHIRGGRTYETGFYIDGVSASDPLAGTGFGLDLGTNSIENIEVTTGGAGVEYGNATAGVVNAETRSGKDKFEFNILRKQDNFGFNKKWRSNFNQTGTEANMGGAIKLNKNKKKLRFFLSAKNLLTNDYYRTPANQLSSSIYGSKPAPRQDNRWSGNVKLNYDFSNKKKLTFSYLKSLNINQDVNMLRITGNDVPFAPGYQYAFAQQPDNANTYTHDTNLESLTWYQLVSKRFSYKLTLSRLFVHLRADANGKAWRPAEVNTEFDPQSITEFPTTAYNPNDSIVFVVAPSGFYNNNGIASLWHDHFAEEITLKSFGTLYSKNGLNRNDFGFEIKQQDLQWIDIYRPWIGAPIQLNNGSNTQSYRLGDISDIWRVKPNRGALFFNDHFKYRGLVADAGLRLEYWMPGKFVDDAIANPKAAIRDEIRESYLAQTIQLFNRNIKTRLLPKFSASFPIKENQVMYFNYGHSTVMPHPSYIYPGLDPYYSDKSALSKLGNPNLNPEVDISYELGLKSQITSNDALSAAAYWKDKYDFISAISIPVKDVTGRDVNRTIQINSDFARIRGFELAYNKRIKKWFEGQASVSYSLATGQSSSSSESLRDIVNNGNRQSTKENYLTWDSPWDIKCYALFTKNTKSGGLFNKKWLNKMSFYSDLIFRSGRRYTPYIFIRNDPNSGRPIYEIDTDLNQRFSKLSTGSYLMNLTFKKWFDFKKINFSISLQITNVLNSKNTLIVNPVTGTAYRFGDPVPNSWKDPIYNDPRDLNSSQLSQGENPARFNEFRHLLVTLNFNLK